MDLAYSEAFRLSGSGTSDLLGIWLARRAEITDDGSMPVWQATFGRDAHYAQAQLTSAEKQLACCEPARVDAQRRLVSFVRDPARVVSFDMSQSALRRAETNLSIVLLAARDPSDIEFGLRENIQDSCSRAVHGYQDWMRRARSALRSLACVETSVGDQPIARTMTSVAGSMHTVWRSDVPTNQMTLHQRTLTLMLRSQRELLRMVVFVARGAVLLASSAALGPLALPAVWRFIEDVRIEVGPQHWTHESAEEGR